MDELAILLPGENHERDSSTDANYLWGRRAENFRHTRFHAVACEIEAYRDRTEAFLASWY